MSKSPDAFRTISEVAEWLDIQAHVLRFWESKFTQVKPVKRAGGRRYYRPSDMLLLGGIQTLLHDKGLSIKDAQTYLRENGLQHVQDLSKPLDGEEEELTASPVEAKPTSKWVEEQPEVEPEPAPRRPAVDRDPPEAPEAPPRRAVPPTPPPYAPPPRPAAPMGMAQPSAQAATPAPAAGQPAQDQAAQDQPDLGQPAEHSPVQDQSSLSQPTHAAAAIAPEGAAPQGEPMSAPAPASAPPADFAAEAAMDLGIAPESLAPSPTLDAAQAASTPPVAGAPAQAAPAMANPPQPATPAAGGFAAPEGDAIPEAPFALDVPMEDHPPATVTSLAALSAAGASPAPATPTGPGQIAMPFDLPSAAAPSRETPHSLSAQASPGTPFPRSEGESEQNDFFAAPSPEQAPENLLPAPPPLDAPATFAPAEDEEPIPSSLDDSPTALDFDPEDLPAPVEDLAEAAFDLPDTQPTERVLAEEPVSEDATEAHFDADLTEAPLIDPPMEEKPLAAFDEPEATVTDSDESGANAMADLAAEDENRPLDAMEAFEPHLEDAAEADALPILETEAEADLAFEMAAEAESALEPEQDFGTEELSLAEDTPAEDLPLEALDEAAMPDMAEEQEDAAFAATEPLFEESEPQEIVEETPAEDIAPLAATGLLSRLKALDNLAPEARAPLHAIVQDLRALSARHSA
ncbi:MerR family transcriptional regulator [Arenibacterium sp. LLYu02]|uniref:MerR family transcriptional regulator n=1 Tax=Arenibacterium sp. LLYu02 TaxID=3404132 RepID=UPI003B21B2B6